MNKKPCRHCGKETLNPKYCSKSCSAKETNKTPKNIRKTKCIKCDKITRNYRSTLCEEHFQQYMSEREESLLDRTLAEYHTRECLKGLHKSSLNAHIRGLARSYHKDMLKKPCYSCGYSKHVELCHIKAITSFPETATIREVNSVSNCIQLCPNCHWELDNGYLSLVFPEQPKSH